MARDNVTFRFKIDMREMTVKGRQAADILRELERRSGGAASSLDRMGTSSSRAGQQTAAAAVNFQTATQGMLNLSTAAVQTFTSISNLDRANNRAKQSVIAVARAEDLLNNKQERLNQLQKTGAGSAGQLANMQREIATATADLTVKQEKMAIEQSAVNDVYMLFATNIANVSISSLQTMGVLLGQERMARVASTLATKLHTLATWDNVRASRTSAVANVTATGSLHAQRSALNLSTIAARLHTSALHAMKIALGPIGLIFIGISAAMAAYESNLGGIKDAINEMLGVQDDFATSVNEARDGVDDLTGSLQDQESQLFKMPSTYEGIKSKLKELKEHYKGVTEEVVKQNVVLVTNKQLNQNFSSGGITTQQTAVGQTIPQGVPGLPMAYADTATSLQDVQLQNRFVSIAAQRGLDVGPGAGQFDLKSPIKGFIKTETGRLIPAGITGKQKAVEIIGQMRNEQAKLLVAETGISFEEALFTVDQDENYLIIAEEIMENALQPKSFMDESFVRGLKTFTPESYIDYKNSLEGKKMLDDARQKAKDKLVQEATKAGISVKELKRRTDISFLAGSFQHKQRLKGGYFTTRTLTDADRKRMEQIGAIINVAGVGNIFTPEKARIAKERRISLLQGDISSLSTDTAFDRLVKDTFLQSHKIGGSGKIFDTNELNLMFASKDFSPSRKAAYDKYGVDIGKIGDVISKEDAERFGMYQAVGNAMNGQVGGQQYTNLFSSFGGSATAAYQVPRGSIATPKHIMKAIRNQDGFANGIGRYLENLTALLTGKKQKLQYRNSFNHKDQTFIGESRGTLNNALDFGFRANQDFVERLNQSLVGIDPQKEGALQRARQNAESSVSIAQEFLKMQFGLLRGVGIESTTVSAIAGEIGFNGKLPAGFLNNLQVLSQMNRSDFNNYDIIHESKNKLNMSNQEVFAIRFDAKRGDDELLDRLRFEDRLEAMSSGTSAF